MTKYGKIINQHDFYDVIRYKKLINLYKKICGKKTI